MVKKCQSKKKERVIRKCFKCDKEGHIAKKCKVQEESGNEDGDEKNSDKKQSFGDDLK